MDSIEVRREFLRQGGSASATARALNTTRQNVEQHVSRANASHPLTYPGERGSEDREAMTAFVKAQLDRIGIAHAG